MGPGRAHDAHDRCADLARRWGVAVDHTFESETSVIANGRRHTQRVVLKAVKQPGDEWHSGAVLHAFAGRGFVRVLEFIDGAMLLERLDPGDALAPMAVNGRDGEATSILASVIAAMSPDRPPAACPTVHDWARGFANYRASGDTRLSHDLVTHAERVYVDLCDSQHAPRLLHGDLQHYNVLFDQDRGWVAVDPKGVIGELEYEIGAIMRNPGERPELLTDMAVIRARLDKLCSTLGLDRERTLAWTFAQAVLSAIWDIEDGYELDMTHRVLILAERIQPMVG